MPTVTTLVVAGWMSSAVLMAALWAWHLRLRNAGVVDVGWAASLALIAGIDAAAGPGDATRRWLIGSMTILWASRVAAHLLFNRVLGKPEDGRYAAIRASWRTNVPLKFFVFFQAQALLAVVLSLPVLIPSFNGAPAPAPLEIAAVAFWMVAVLGEAIADRQLEAFKRDAINRGRVCDAGLWGYSRHPNYFFEWLIWMAYALYALASPWGWLAIAGPAIILYLLLRVTGIPPTEAQSIRSRGDAYRRYQQTTSAFVPWFPRRTA